MPITKTPKHILTLARRVLEGQRGTALAEFKAIADANGYEGRRGGWVWNYRTGERVARGWVGFAYDVSETREVVLEPIADPMDTPTIDTPEGMAHPLMTASQAEQVRTDAENQLDEVDEFERAAAAFESLGVTFPSFDAMEAATAAGYVNGSKRVDVTYLYITRAETIPLSGDTMVTVCIQDERESFTEGMCESGAALGCTGVGFLRILPESMLPGQDRQSLIQCLPCYEWSANAYVRKLHHYGEVR